MSPRELAEQVYTELENLHKLSRTRADQIALTRALLSAQQLLLLLSTEVAA